VRLPRLREWREARGLIQNDLARAAGVSKFTVVRIEHGANTHPDTARKLAKALEIDVIDLLESPPVPKAPAPSRSGQPRNKPAEEPEKKAPPAIDVALDAARRQNLSDRQAIARAVESGLPQDSHVVHENKAFRDLLNRSHSDVAEALVDLARDYVFLERDLAAHKEVLHNLRHGNLTFEDVDEALVRGTEDR
jgi:transcriptional regulator with XRE-family HTH domain